MPTLSSVGSSLSNALPSWSTTKTTSKAGFDAAWSALDKLGAPVNKLTNKIGSEAFWPTTLDKESDKAARILRSFVKDGFYADEAVGKGNLKSSDGPKAKQRVVKKIPTEVIRRAKGLAIFTTCRTGLWVSGAGGSGVLVARTATGAWSPPSGILLHTAGLGFLVGVDIYDCVVVINTEAAMKAFTKIRCTVGGEVSAVAGPVGIGGILESEIHKRQAPVWTYLKSRGFYAGVQVDGTVIIERMDENERFYGEKIGVQDILAGKVRHPPREIAMLMSTIKMAQGDTVDEKALPDARPTPGDLKAEEVIEMSDPDPLGVQALEKEGIEIKEAGTLRRPSLDEFESRPSPTSPIFQKYKLPPREVQAGTLPSTISSTTGKPILPPRVPPREPPVAPVREEPEEDIAELAGEEHASEPVELPHDTPGEETEEEHWEEPREEPKEDEPQDPPVKVVVEELPAHEARIV
ncbi:hypothetical protein MMC34_007133 [Xylographa carneopallida]|nr:hypothetical protein [Xylographa carneopallida]